MNPTHPTQPALVFIHVFLDGADAWSDLALRLGDGAAGALRVDLPGMGARAGEPSPYSLDRFAADVTTQVRALSRPVVLVGHSMGAQIAELVAQRLDEQVRGVVLLTPQCRYAARAYPTTRCAVSMRSAAIRPRSASCAAICR
ncbi:alpha/beta fold hydrolase [Paraburkholderia sp. SIMBA_049]